MNTPDTFAIAPVQMQDVDAATLARETFTPDGFDMPETIPVRVYRNLHKDCVSIQARINGRWLVVGHASEVELAGVRFQVSEAGRARVLSTGRKNVHAFVTGGIIAAKDLHVRARNAAECRRTMTTLRHAMMWLPECDGFPVGYNPMRAATFTMRHDGSPIHAAAHATVSTRGVIAA